MNPAELAIVGQTWLRSHEEESGGQLIYRPQSYQFPPARGRSALSLAPEGKSAMMAPGPDDRPVERSGNWMVTDDDHLLIETEGRRQRFKIISVGQDKLVLQKA